MVSLARALQCIGRPIKSREPGGPEGNLIRIAAGRGVIRTDDGELTLSLHRLEWDDQAFGPVVEALRTGTNYKGAQAFVQHDHYMDEYIFIGSPAMSNDDNESHMLYVGLPMMRRFHPVRPTADPWAAYFFEEVCGWARP